MTQQWLKLTKYANNPELENVWEAEMSEKQFWFLHCGLSWCTTEKQRDALFYFKRLLAFRKCLSLSLWLSWQTASCKWHCANNRPYFLTENGSNNVIRSHCLRYTFAVHTTCWFNLLLSWGLQEMLLCIWYQFSVILGDHGSWHVIIIFGATTTQTFDNHTRQNARRRHLLKRCFSFLS